MLSNSIRFNAVGGRDGSVSSTSHVIEFSDGTHHCSRIVFLSPDQPRPSASGLTTTAALAGRCRSHRYRLDLLPDPLDVLVALRYGDSPTLFLKSEANVVGLPLHDHFGEEFNPVRCPCSGGSCHGQSASSSHR